MRINETMHNKEVPKEHILETVHQKEYYPEGNLAYECIVYILKPEFHHLYEFRMRSKTEGAKKSVLKRERNIPKQDIFWIRKKAIKYNQDGSVQWRIDYNAQGRPLKK